MCIPSKCATGRIEERHVRMFPSPDLSGRRQRGRERREPFCNRSRCFLARDRHHRMKGRSYLSTREYLYGHCPVVGSLDERATEDAYSPATAAPLLVALQCEDLRLIFFKKSPKTLERRGVFVLAYIDGSPVEDLAMTFEQYPAIPAGPWVNAQHANEAALTHARRGVRAS